MALLLVLVRPFLAAAFLPSEDAQAVAMSYWLIAPFGIVGYAIAMAASAGFNGLGRPLIGASVNILRGFGLIVPLVLLGGMLAGMQGVIWAMFAANILAGVLVTAYVLRFAPLSVEDSRSKG
jgi:Na+-driven multidrug efflux pump